MLSLLLLLSLLSLLLLLVVFCFIFPEVEVVVFFFFNRLSNISFRVVPFNVRFLVVGIGVFVEDVEDEDFEVVVELREICAGCTCNTVSGKKGSLPAMEFIILC